MVVDYPRDLATLQRLSSDDWEALLARVQMAQAPHPIVIVEDTATYIRRRFDEGATAVAISNETGFSQPFVARYRTHGRNRKYTAEENARLEVEITARLQSGEAVRDISEALRVQPTRVYDIRNKLGIEWRKTKA